MEQLAAMLREAVQDKGKFLELSDFAIAHAEYEAVMTAPNTNRARMIKSGLEILSHENANAVFSRPRSAIEIIFLNSLALCFINNSLPLLMVTDVPDVTLYVNDLRKQLSQFRLLAGWYKENCGNADDILTHLQNEVKMGRMPQKDRRFLVRWFLTYEWLNLGREYHLVLEAGFPHVKVSGRSIRTDLFLWIPDKEEMKLVVECDGFQWHGNRDAFTNDRKRDRALQDQNIQVRRFSGSEIHNDPAGAANDLFSYLFHRRS